MKLPIPRIKSAVRLLAFLAAACGALQAVAGVVTYEAFGAKGDGVTDDLPAICKAHEHANSAGLVVRSDPAATYHLGRKALTAVIATDTDWGTSRFVIDDSKGVDHHQKPLFEVRSLLKPVSLKLDRLKQGQTRIEGGPASDCLVVVENRNRRLFMRRGLNRNQGTPQHEAFILRRDGSITGGIDWDYDVITRVEAWPIDPKPLVLRGGVFTNIASTARAGQDGYWSRNIVVRRSNTVVDGLVHRVTGETDSGNPYEGFLNLQRCADVIVRNCTIDARRPYEKIGNAGKPVAVGTYGYQANLVVNLQLIQCRMEDIHDRSRWGVSATNFMKNLLVEDCVLSRIDVHQGVSGAYIIRRSTIGHAGINAIGRGRLVIEDSTIHSRHLVRFRDDYGATWDGEVLIRNSRWLPPSGGFEMFGVRNDGTHDFGYPCSMPHTIRIDGLFVDDSENATRHEVPVVLGDPGGGGGNPPFPYLPTRRIEIRGLETASGKVPAICADPKVAEGVKVVSSSPIRKTPQK